MNIIKTQWIVLLAIFLFGMGMAYISTLHMPFWPWQAKCNGCNVVIVDIDIVRAQELPCYGYSKNTMPNLCRFADRNILFSQAHAQSTWTFPNQVSLFTSLYQTNHGMDDPLHDTLHPSIQTLPAQYKKAGYHTIFIGNARDENLQLRGGLGRAFDSVIDTHDMSLKDQIDEWKKVITIIQKGPRSNPPIFLYAYTEYAGDYRGADIGIVTDSIFDPSFVPPTFSNLNVFTKQTLEDAKTHAQYNIYRKTGLSSVPEYQDILNKLESAKTLAEAKKAFDLLDPFEQHLIYSLEIHKQLNMDDPLHRAYVQNIYDNRLFQLDEQLQTILDMFDNKELKDNTILTIFSDHGENLGDHGLLGHATQPYDTVTHVPLIMHIPGFQNQVIDTLIQLVDLYPTLLTLTHLALPHPIAGVSLIPLLSDKHHVSPGGTFAISEVNKAQDQSIRTPEWRLVLVKSTTPISTQLYHLSVDPQETQNVARENPQKVTQLTNQLKSVIARLPTYPR